MRDGAAALLDHVAKEMNELNLERCKCIPTNTPGADWRCLEAIVRDDPSREKFKARASALKFLQHMRPGQCAACRSAPDGRPHVLQLLCIRPRNRFVLCCCPLLYQTAGSTRVDE